MQAEPTREHRWLQKLVGNWTYEHRASMGPDKPLETFRGTETVRPIGDLWIVCDGSGAMPDGDTATMVLTLGFDPQKRRFVGTWIGSMMTHLWHYEGSLDASGNVLVLESEGPSFSPEGGTARYRDSIDLRSDEHRLFSSSVLGPDGAWTTFMNAEYRRAK
ncbi:MAG TPA: DUF1579 domain-containing protein [Tepidisphaeraceae bacterium]|nr:DUF1579 domain-containing protein [Tepidisphaeraceae bacterium]